MDRRQLTNTLVSVSFSGAVAAGIAAMNSPMANRQLAFACLSCSLLVFGATRLQSLWSTAGSGSPEARSYISLVELGRAIYRKGSPELQKAMIGFVPSPFQTLDAAGRAYAIHAVKECGVQLYGRRSEGAELEPVPLDEVEHTAIEVVFGERPAITDLAIKRSGRGKVLSVWKASRHGKRRWLWR